MGAVVGESNEGQDSTGAPVLVGGYYAAGSKVFRLRTDSAGNLLVSTGTSGLDTIQGNVASGVADTGNPVKTGGVFNTTQPTVTTGQRVDSQSSARGSLLITQGVEGLQISGTVASLATDSGNPVKIGGVYLTAPPAPTNGQRVDLQSDSQGDLKVYMASAIYGEDPNGTTPSAGVLGVVQKPVIASTYSPSVYWTATPAITANIKNTAGLLRSIYASNTNAALRWLQLSNDTGAHTTVIASFPIPAGTTAVPGVLTIGLGSLGDNGMYFSTGITYGISTTQGTYAAGTNTDHNIFATYN